MSNFESKEWRSARLIHVNVDVQNDFCPGGSLAVTEGDLIIPNLNRLTGHARVAGGVVVFTRDWHPRVTNHFDVYGGIWPPHCVAGTYGAEFRSDLSMNDDDPIISKGTKQNEDAYSGFQGVDELGRSLAEIITPGPERPVIVTIGGLATDYCVKATVLDGLGVAKKYPNSLRIIAVTDAMAAVNRKKGDGEKALAEMESAGAIILTTDGVATELGRLGLVAA